MQLATGTPENDELFGSAQTDTSFEGLSGDDTLFGGGSKDTLDGGEGNDWANYSGFFEGAATFENGVHADLTAGTTTFSLSSAEIVHELIDIENLSGSRSNDTLTGDASANELQGKKGNDALFGGGGDDTLFGGRGNDTLNGDDGNDNLFASDGNGTLDGGNGDDWILFGATLSGNPIFVEGVQANLSASNASAIIDGTTYTYTIHNFENLKGSQYNDMLVGDDMASEFQGSLGDDQLFGRGGNDTLFGGSGNDTLFGGEGDDFLYAMAGNELLDGGSGEDFAHFSTFQGGKGIFEGGVTVDLSTSSATAQLNGTSYSYILNNIESIHGSDASDDLLGDDNANEIQGLRGDDALFGRAGNDTLYGGEGNDTLKGGDGDDTLYATFGNATLDGGNGTDRTLFSTFSSGEPIFKEGVEVDLSTGIATAKNDGTTYFYALSNVENLAGSYGADVLHGDDGDNELFGRDGDDIIKGGAGDDFIAGEGGNDIALYDGASKHFTLQFSVEEQQIFIIDRTGAEGTDTRGTNILRFSDRDVIVVTDGYTSIADTDPISDDFVELAELYIAYFNRAPDAEGLMFWAHATLNGTTIDEAAQFFFNQPETQALYGSDSDPSRFVIQVYENVLGRKADPEGSAFWVEVLATGTVTEGQFIRAFLEGARSPSPANASAEFAAQKDADRAYLDGKTYIGTEFAATRGLSDLSNAKEIMALFDGTDESIETARAAIEEAYQDALATDGSGEFLIQVIGLVDNPFANPF